MSDPMSLIANILGKRKPNLEGDCHLILETNADEVWIGMQSEKSGDSLLRRYPINNLPILIANLEEAYKAAKAAQTKMKAEL